MKVLYSINSWLSFKVAEVYYSNRHYVWCAPFFDGNGENPPSSDPSKIYKTYADDIIGKDKHSAKIAQNRTGIIKGAGYKFKEGIITKDQYDEIVMISNEADFLDFRPLVYVIPYNLVDKIVKPASVKIKANYFSKEYIIEELNPSQFDTLDLLNL